MSTSVVNWGGGVQSTAIALLVLSKDERLARVMPLDTDWPSKFYFADTGDEPKLVYDHVSRMSSIMSKGGLEVVEVKRDKEWPLSSHILERAERGDGGISMIPMFVKTSTTPSPVRRGCTQDYKVKPIEKALRLAYGRTHIYQWFGISADESQRMRISQKKSRSFFYPLVSMGWKREHCISYLKQHGIEAPRSSCYYCPFHSNLEWKRIGKDERARSAAFEKRLHDIYDKGGIAGLKTKPYLHRSLSPISDLESQKARMAVVFRTASPID